MLFSASPMSLIRLTVVTKLIKKKRKNCPGVLLNPTRKYRMMLKTTADMNLSGMSMIRPAAASVQGW